MESFGPEKPALGTKSTVDATNIQEDLAIRTISNPILMQPPGPGPRVQIGTVTMSVQYTPQNAPPASYHRLTVLGKQHSNKTTPSSKGILVAARASHSLYVSEKNRFRALLTAHSADAADLCLRTSLDPDVLQAAITLQMQKTFTDFCRCPTSKTAEHCQRGSVPTIQTYRRSNPQRNKARATRPPTRRLLFPPSAPTNTIPVIDLTDSLARGKRKADVLEDAEDPEDGKGLKNAGGISATKRPMMDFFGRHVDSKK